jgi:hypothetical protein
MKTTARIDLKVHNAQELIDIACATVFLQYLKGDKKICEDVELHSVALSVKGEIEEETELTSTNTRVAFKISFKARSIIGYFHDEECDNIAFFVDGKEVDLEQCINEYLEREVL